MSAFKKLSAKEKMQYLWEYYKWIPIVLIIIICFVVAVVGNLSGKTDYDAYCLILNDYENTELCEHITAGFENYMGDDFKLSTDNGFLFNYNEEHGINRPDDAASIKFVKLMSDGQADVALSDQNTLKWACYKEFATPINEVLPEEISDELQPYFVYYKDGKIPYGLDISKTEVYKGHSHNYEDAVVFVPTWTKKPEISAEFIKYLFGITK